MSRSVVLLFIVIGCSLVMAHQYQSPSGGRNELAKQSDAIVVGLVEGTSWVVRPEKKTNKTKTLSGGRELVDLQNPAEYVVGRLVQLRVSEVVKRGGGVRVNTTLSIFIPGAFTVEGGPAFVEKQKYLVFLSRSKSSAGDFAGTVVQNPSDGLSKDRQFNPASSYVVVGGTSGALRLDSQNQKIVNEVKTLTRTSRS